MNSVSAFCGRFSLCNVEGPCNGGGERCEGGLIIISLFAVCFLIPYIIFNGNCHILSAPVRGEHKASAFAAVCHLPPASRQRAPGSEHFPSGRQHLPPATCHQVAGTFEAFCEAASRQVGECLDRRLKRLLGAWRTCAAFHGRSGESVAEGNRGGGGGRGRGKSRGSACKDAGRMLCPLSVMFVFPFLLLFSFSLYCECACVCECI